MDSETLPALYACVDDTIEDAFDASSDTEPLDADSDVVGVCDPLDGDVLRSDGNVPVKIGAGADERRSSREQDTLNQLSNSINRTLPQKQNLLTSDSSLQGNLVEAAAENGQLGVESRHALACSMSFDEPSRQSSITRNEDSLISESDFASVMQDDQASDVSNLDFNGWPKFASSLSVRRCSDSNLRKSFAGSLPPVQVQESLSMKQPNFMPISNSCSDFGQHLSSDFDSSCSSMTSKRVASARMPPTASMELADDKLMEIVEEQLERDDQVLTEKADDDEVGVEYDGESSDEDEVDEISEDDDEEVKQEFADEWSTEQVEEIVANEDGEKDSKVDTVTEIKEETEIQEEKPPGEDLSASAEPTPTKKRKPKKKKVPTATLR